MFKRIISICTTVIIMTTILAFAEQKTVIKNIRTTDEIVEQITSDTVIDLKGNSMKYNFELLFYCDEENLEQQREDIREFLEDIWQIVSKTTEVDYSYTSDNYDCRMECRMSFDGSFATKSPGAAIRILNDYVRAYFGDYETGDSEPLMKYIAENAERVLASLTCEKQEYNTVRTNTGEFDFENKVIVGTAFDQKYRDVENIEFDITLDETFSGTPFENAGDIGETIHCTINNYSTGSSWYVLKLKGSNGEIGFMKYTNEAFSGSTTGRYLDFDINSKFEDNVFYRLEDSPEFGHIRLCGYLSDGTVGGASLMYMPDHTPFEINPTNQIDAKNIEYEYLWSEEKLKNGRNLYSLFGIPEKTIEITYDEEDEISKPGDVKTEKSEVEEVDTDEEAKKEKDGVQDPERFVSFIKGPTKDGGYWDYDINFIARLDLDERRVMPDWYEALGDDVTATIMGLTHTFNGKVRRTSTMLRFQGSKDTIWFESGNTFFHEKEAGKPIVWECEYNSLLFFDGATTINNTIDYETIDSTLKFSNDGNMTLEAITLEIYEEEFEMGEDEIKYISGGKEVYEKFN